MNTFSESDYSDEESDARPIETFTTFTDDPSETESGTESGDEIGASSQQQQLAQENEEDFSQAIAYIESNRALYKEYLEVRKRGEELAVQPPRPGQLVPSVSRRRTFRPIPIERDDMYEQKVKSLLLYMLYKTTGNLDRAKELLRTKAKKWLKYYLSQFLLFGVLPGFLENPSGEGFEQRYFIWTKGEQGLLPRAPQDLAITSNNFSEYVGVLPFEGWSKRHLYTYLSVNIIPTILERLGVSIDMSLFSKMINRKLSAKVMKNLIKLHVENPESLILRDVIDGMKADFESERILGRRTRRFSISDFHVRKLYLVIFDILRKKLIRKKQLLAKMKSVVQPRRESKRFRWQKLCTPGGLDTVFNMEELREVASWENIPEHMFMTKRELCGELAQRFENVINGKKKIESRCVNPQTIMMTDTSDVPPEFFYAYTHNNKVYCDDIRDLQKHFQTSGATHPWDRTPVSEALVRTVDSWYNQLVRKTTIMDDLFTAPGGDYQMSETSLLSSKVADFLSKLNYPNSGQLLIDADTEHTLAFVDALVDEGIMSNQERRMLSAIDNLTQYKLTMIEILMVKIRNDPDMVQVPGARQPLSTVAINLSNVYNEVFN